MKSISSKRSFVLLAALGGTILSTASVAHAAKPYTYIGCYADEGTRDIPYEFGSSSMEMTLEGCASICSLTGQPYFGVQAGNECFCGSSYGSYGTSTACNMSCAGNSSETCGGSWANSVYLDKFVPPGDFMGCFADSSTRDLPFQFYSDGLDMTAEQCRSSCYTLGYTYAGMQAGDQCWCGDSYGSQGKSTSCTASCYGNGAEVCGGPFANDVWTATLAPGFLGCFQDESTRDLPVELVSKSPGMSVEACRSACNAAGYAIAGVQDGDQCFCGNSYGGYGTSTKCTSVCKGDDTEVCGGPGVNSIWESAAVPFRGNSLWINATLYAGNVVNSPSGKLYLTMQTDGNLVLRFSPFGPSKWSTILWASNTYGNPGAWATFQPDGNFVVYASNGNALWATGTNGKGSNSVVVQDDGNLVVYNGSKALWATGTNNLVPDSAHCASDFCPAGTWWSSCEPPFDSNGSDEPYGPGVYVWCNGHTETPGATPDQWLNYFAWTNPNPTDTCNNNWGTLDCSPQGPNDVECNNCFFY